MRRRGSGFWAAVSWTADESGAGVSWGSPDERALPPRPAVPPTLACAVALWAVCACSFYLARSLDVGACVVAALVGLLAAVGGFAVLWRTPAVLAGAVLLGAALGLACGMGGAAAQHEAEQLVVGQSGTWRFEAVDDASEGTYGYTCLARASVPGVGTVKVMLQFDAEDVEPLRYGDVIEAAATFVAVSETSAAYRWRQGVVARATIHDADVVERSDLFGLVVRARNAAISLVTAQADDDAAGPAILAALVCGWRELLDGMDIYEDFKTCGLAHLVAVSGAHLSIVCACAASLLGALRAPRAVSVCTQVGLILSYLVLAGMPVSAVRAAFMTLAGMFSFTARRRPASLSALSICMIACVSTSPTTALSVSFALSALSTLGIVLFSGLFGAWIGHVVPVMPRTLKDAVALTFASSVMSTPLSAALFSQVPLVAPLANAVVAPLFPLVCCGGLLAVVGALAVPFASSALVGVGCAAAGLLAKLVSALAQVPYASLSADVTVPLALVASCALAIALWIVWPRPRRSVVAVLAGASAAVFLCLVLVVPLAAGTQIVMLNVDQGDSFLIRSKGVAVLVDTGNQDTMLKSALARHGVTHLDAVIVTHGDDDHMGSLTALSGVVSVDRVFVAADALTCDCDNCVGLIEDAVSLVGEENVYALEVGDVLEVGFLELEVIWPEAFQDEGGNADSLCLLVRADVDADGTTDWTALFVGDVEAEQLSEIVESGVVGEVDIYKVGHHGSKNALTEELALALSPAIALVSCGENNSYGHPAEVTIAALEAAGASILCSDEVGDVTCTLKADEIVVRTQQ